MFLFEKNIKLLVLNLEKNAKIMKRGSKP